MSPIEAVISDFGGVLTSPMLDSFAAVQDASGIGLAALGRAMAAIAAREGTNPLFELETGRISEQTFLAAVSRELTAQLGRPTELDGFGERYFAHLYPNERMIDYMRALHDRGLRTAICTNNVREWDARWRAKLPVDEIFDVVVDSAFVGTRKPERRIYEITLRRLGVAPGAAVMVDDVGANCTAAEQVGIHAVVFHTTEQAIDAIEAVLGSG